MNFVFLLSMLLYKEIKSQILPDRCMKAGYIALTFDEGPTAYTSHVLEILENENVPATFHFTTQYINRPNIASKIDQTVEEDHLIGLKLSSSRNYDDMDADEVKDEIETQLDVLSETTGKKIKYVRAAVEDGETNQNIYQTLQKKGIIQTGYTYCFYHETDDIDSAEVYIDKLFKQTNPKYDSFIFLLHEEKEKDFPILEYLIKKGKKAGYEFVTLEKCLQNYKPGTHVNIKRKSKKSKNISSLLYIIFSILLYLLLVI